MPISYVEEVVARYLMKNGYLVTRGIWFKLPKQKGKKIRGWSDVDILAVKSDEAPLIIQCKSFLGTQSSKIVATKIIKWFKNAETYLRNDTEYRKWFNRKSAARKVLVVDHTVIKTEQKLMREKIKIWHYEDKLRALLKSIKVVAEEMGKRRGKEEDILLRILSDMIRRKMIIEQIFEER